MTSGPDRKIEVTPEAITSLAEYATIPIVFEVDRVFDVDIPNDILANIILIERTLENPYIKNYDAIEDPSTWPNRFDMSNWSMFTARLKGRLVGGAIIAFDTPDLDMLEGRSDLAVLWDIRVAPEARGLGVGSVLFRTAETWATKKGCRRLKIETQNINVAACRFYAHHGCVIGKVDRLAYAELPEEMQLIWHKEL